MSADEREKLWDRLDDFATAALMGMASDHSGGKSPQEVAEQCYDLAAAMVLARDGAHARLAVTQPAPPATEPAAAHPPKSKGR